MGGEKDVVFFLVDAFLTPARGLAFSDSSSPAVVIDLTFLAARVRLAGIFFVDTFSASGSFEGMGLAAACSVVIEWLMLVSVACFLRAGSLGA